MGTGPIRYSQSFPETEGLIQFAIFQIPLPVKILKDIKSSFQIFKPGPGGDSESPNLKGNKLCQVFTTQILPQNWHVKFAGEGGPFMPVSSNSKEGAFQICST